MKIWGTSQHLQFFYQVTAVISNLKMELFCLSLLSYSGTSHAQRDMEAS